jgi:hypothetical protein
MMSLKKEIKIGDELLFECNKIDPAGSKNILMKLTETIGRKAVLNITADRSIPIRHFRNNDRESKRE